MNGRWARALSAALFLIAGCNESEPPEQTEDVIRNMQLVPGATFRMGSDYSEIEDIRRATGLRTVEPLLAEVPARDVTVEDFFIDIYDVTNRDFAAFVAANPAWGKGKLDASEHNGRYLEHWTPEGPPENSLDHPVTYITWPSAVAYCAWRDKRVPTEAEYEWAAQDGTTRAEYPWGDDPPSDDLVSWGGNGIDTTVPVGSYPANARGLYDMSGNVWRFTSDPWLGPYSEIADAQQGGADDENIRRVVRGGSWGANAANLRVRYRDSHRPFDAREMVGFRCAMSATRDRPRVQ